eukprot:2137211-Lingulodinium_polyedra.AAC.1
MLSSAATTSSVRSAPALSCSRDPGLHTDEPAPEGNVVAVDLGGEVLGLGDGADLASVPAPVGLE